MPRPAAQRRRGCCVVGVQVGLDHHRALATSGHDLIGNCFQQGNAARAEMASCTPFCSQRQGDAFANAGGHR